MNDAKDDRAAFSAGFIDTPDIFIGQNGEYSTVVLSALMRIRTMPDSVLIIYRVRESLKRPSGIGIYSSGDYSVLIIVLLSWR